MYFSEWDVFRKASSLAHTLKNKLKIWQESKDFWCRHVDFLNPDMNPSSIIGTMHQVSLLVTGNMSKYYTTDHIAVILQHALRHCVRDLFTTNQQKHFSSCLSSSFDESVITDNMTGLVGIQIRPDEGHDSCVMFHNHTYTHK